MIPYKISSLFMVVLVGIMIAGGTVGGVGNGDSIVQAPSPAPDTEPVPVSTRGRLQPTDLKYQGAFRLSEDFSWGTRGMSYYPHGSGGSGSLLIIGFDLRQAEFAEVAIPKPVITENWQMLPGTILLRAMTNFGANVVESVNQETVFATGIEYVPRQESQTSDR